MGSPRRHGGPQGQSRRGEVYRDARNEGFGDRLKRLRSWHEAWTGEEMTQARIAEKLSLELGGGVRYSGSAVGAWLHNQWTPATDVIAAVARVFKCDAGWLAFGVTTEARDPETKRRKGDETDGAARIAEVVNRRLDQMVPSPPRPMEPPDEERPPVVRRRPKRA